MDLGFDALKIEPLQSPILTTVGTAIPTLYIGLWLRLECSLDSLSIDSAHVIYVSEGYDVAYNRRTASQPSHVVLRVTWYVKTFQKRKLRVLNPARINVFYWFNWLNLIGS